MREDIEITEIPREECLKLLSQHSMGRLAVVHEDQPLIFPVNYAVDGDVVVFRTDPGVKLAEAPLRHVAFEVDEVDFEAGTGWSVLVQGHAHEITNAIDRRSVPRRRLPISLFAPGEKSHWIEIMADAITGRRLRPRNGDAAPGA